MVDNSRDFVNKMAYLKIISMDFLDNSKYSDWAKANLKNAFLIVA